MFHRTQRQILKERIQLNKEEIQYNLIISDKAKNISLKISPEKGLEVVVPRRSRLSGIPRIIHEKENWIIKHLESIRKKELKKEKLQDGARLTIGGVPYSVRVINSAKTPKAKELRPLQFTSDSAYYGEPELRIYCNGTQSEINKTAEKFLREKTRTHFTARTKEIAEEMELTFNKISIKGQKTRWGSCSRQKNLNFNWRLILCDTEIIDSIIIHELAHTVFLNHGKSFYHLVERFCPNHRKLTARLNHTSFII